MIDQKRMQRDFLALSYLQATFGEMFFIVFWTLMTALMTVTTVIVPISQQVSTYWFESTRGIVKHSEVKVDWGDTNTLNVNIGYEYTVGQQTWIGDQLRYGLVESNDSYAEEFVKEHPAGSLITVYFDPKNPKESVLIRGIEGSDVFSAFLLLPFNLIVVVGWYLVILHFRYWKNRTIRRVRTRVSGIEQSSNGYIKSLEESSWGAGLFVSIFMPIPIVLAVGFTTGSHPSIGVAITCWIVVLGTASIVVSVFPSSNPNRWNYSTLEMNERVVRVYRLGKSRPLAELQFDDVKSIKVHERIDDKRGSDMTIEYDLQAITPSVADLTLTSFRDLEEANRNAELIAGELKVEFHQPVLSESSLDRV